VPLFHLSLTTTPVQQKMVDGTKHRAAPYFYTPGTRSYPAQNLVPDYANVQHTPTAPDPTPQKWFHLDGRRWVNVKVYKNKLYIGVRQFTQEGHPTRTGINMSKEEWERLLTLAPEINTAVDEVEKYVTPAQPTIQPPAAL
jgi:hypothetical protein